MSSQCRRTLPRSRRPRAKVFSGPESTSARVRHPFWSGRSARAGRYSTPSSCAIPNTRSEYDPVSVISTSGRFPVPELKNRSMACRQSRSVPATILWLVPNAWSFTGAPHLFRGCGIPARAGAVQPGWWVRAVSAAVGGGVEVGRPCSEVVGPVSFGDLGPSDGGGDVQAEEVGEDRGGQVGDQGDECGVAGGSGVDPVVEELSLIHISEPTRLGMNSY